MHWVYLTQEEPPRNPVSSCNAPTPFRSWRARGLPIFPAELASSSSLNLLLGDLVLSLASSRFALGWKSQGLGSP